MKLSYLHIYLLSYFYPEKFHPHIHAIVSDGLFAKTGTFYVMPGVDLRPLEETCPPSLSLRRGGRVLRLLNLSEHFPGDLTLFPKFAMVMISVFNR